MYASVSTSLNGKRHRPLVDPNVDLAQQPRTHNVDTSIGDDGVRHIAGLENLRTLHLSATKVTDAGFQHLANLRKLKTLLVGTPSGDDGLDHISGLTELTNLTVG